MLIQNFLPSTATAKESVASLTTTTEDREAVQICVIGSLEGIARIVYDLHRRGFAEVNEWSKAQPTGKSGEYIRLLRRYILRRS